VEARRLPLFAKNPSYFGGAPKTDSPARPHHRRASTAVAEFESGNVDVLQIPAGEASEWEEDESRKPLLKSTPALELVYIAINCTRGPLADARVRRPSTTRSTSTASSSG
jgi:ABC-type oligopeptide transport system substrate-binding subunit